MLDASVATGIENPIKTVSENGFRHLKKNKEVKIMRDYPRIPSKYTVQLVDFSRFNGDALEHYNKDREDDEVATDCKTMYRHGFIDTDYGMFILCDEGVGNKEPVSEEHPYQLDFWQERKEGDVTRMGIGPCLTMKLQETIIRECATGKTEPLHEFIRTFGDRLDSNYIHFESHIDSYKVTTV